MLYCSDLIRASYELASLSDIIIAVSHGMNEAPAALVPHGVHRRANTTIGARVRLGSGGREVPR